VKKDNLARCAWCGTPESDEWITRGRNEIFCSSECQAAKYSTGANLAGYVFTCLGGGILVLFFFASLAPNILGDPRAVAEVVVYGLFFLIVGVGTVIGANRGKKYQDRKDKYRDVTLLVCEYCTQANPPSITRCRHCGASLTKAVFSYETTPPWIQKRRLNRFRCPRCNAVYSYNLLNLQSGGTVKCQNCDRPFVLSRPLVLVDDSIAARSLYPDV